MPLAIRGPNLVILGRFEQFGGKYELTWLSPLTYLNTYAMGLTPFKIFLNLSVLRLTLDV